MGRKARKLIFMHSLSTRANAVFCFGLFTLFGLACLNAVTHPFLANSPLGKVSFNQVKKLQQHKPLRSDHALITSDLDVDFSPIWTWNTKQIFLYIYAEYETEDNKLNQVVVYDAIIESKDDTRIKQENMYAKYWLADMGFNLRNRDITLHIEYDITPITGMILNYAGPKSDLISMPPEYSA